MHTTTLAGPAADDHPCGATLTDCMNSLVEYVERAGPTDITLLGHSWGGHVLTGAGRRLAAWIRRLVFWSAFVPRRTASC